MSKYVNGYLPKIQYWSAKLQKAVDAADAKPNVRYEVADGSLIDNNGRKTFNAVTNCGVLHNMTA